MYATLSKLSSAISRTLMGSAGMLPAMSGILPDNIERYLIFYPTRTCVVRRQHAGGGGQNARAPEL